MYVNIIHRPKPGRLYPFFEMQQDLAHRLGLKVTLMASYPSMLDPEAVDALKRYSDEHGDEIGLFFGELTCPEFLERIGSEEFSYWLYSREDKRRIAEMLLDQFRQCFGRDPVSVASYYFDAPSITLLKEMCPSIEIAIAACFEEGVPVFHGCNNSWYLFNEGGPWGPWYPSRSHTLRPAADGDDWAGVVAVTHLSRDMALSYESRNDYFATHPPNVMRGKGNDGAECPYSLNLIDQFLNQERYNDGFSYINFFVGPNWLGHSPNFEETPEVAQKLYRESLEYLVELRGRGLVTDTYMSEFAASFRKERPIGRPEVCLAREVLYGSGKHYVWYVDPHLRTLIDANQGGSIGDLRPYAGRVDGATGPDTPRLADGSYPYLIQSQRRTGIANHSFDGARTTLLVTHDGETVDLCRCRTRCAEIETNGDGVHVRLTPARLRFRSGFSAAVETSYHFPGDGQIIVERLVTGASDPGAELVLEEYVKGCYGTTEYPEDMHGIRLSVRGAADREIEFDYRCRTIETKEARAVSARIPQANAELSLKSLDGPREKGRAVEGFVFNPYYTLSLSAAVTPGRRLTTCLSVDRAT